MSKVHISPTMISIIADNCKTVEDLQSLLRLVDKTIHPYQRGHIQGMIEKMKQENEQKSQEEAIDNDYLFPLKDLMSDYHITRGRLAFEMGVDRETVSDWLLNKQRLTDEQIEKLHEFFEYQLELDH